MTVMRKVAAVAISELAKEYIAPGDSRIAKAWSEKERRICPGKLRNKCHLILNENKS